MPEHLSSQEEPPAVPQEGAEHVPSEEERRLRLMHLTKLHGGLYENQPQKIDFRLVDISAWVDQLAEVSAEDRLREYMNQTGASAFFKKAFAHIDEDAYRKKFIEDTRHAIKNNRNLMASIEARVFGRGSVIAPTTDFEKKTHAQFDSVLRHFAEDLHDEEERGEKFVANEDLNNVASSLFFEYATGVIKDRTAFEHRVESDIIPMMGGRKFAKDGVGGLNTQSRNENFMHASNLFHWAETYKLQIQQLTKDAIEKFGDKDAACIKRYVKGMLRFDLHVQLEKRARTLAPGPAGKLSRSQKVVSFLQGNNKFLPDPLNRIAGAVVANPIAMGIVGALAGRWAVRAAVTAGIVATAGPTSVVLAAMAGGTAAAMLFSKIRAGKEARQDRGMVMRDTALGRTASGPRAAEVAGFVGEMKSAEIILADLRSISGHEIDPAAIDAGRKVIADARARLEVFIDDQVHAIKLSAEEGEKNLSMSEAIDEIKRELKRIGVPAGKDEAMIAAIEQNKAHIINALKEKNKEFAEYESKKSNRKAIYTGIFSFVAGAITSSILHSDMYTQSAVGRGFHAAGQTISGGWAATKRLFSTMCGGSNAPIPNAASMHNGIFDFMDTPRGTHDIPFARGTMHLPANRFFVPDGNGNGHIVTAFGRQVSPTFHINADGTVMEPAGTGEWNSYINHNVVTVPGQEYSPDLAPHNFGNHAVTNHFELPKNLTMVEDPTTHTFAIKNQAGNVLESGIQLDPNGKLTPASEAMLQRNGWNIGRNNGYDMGVPKAYNKDELTKHLRANYSQAKAHRLDWHDNNTGMHKTGGHYESKLPGVNGSARSLLKPNFPAGSQWTTQHVGGRWVGADGKELQLKLLGEPGARTLSLRDMINNSIHGADNLNDASIDDKFGDISDQTKARQFAEAAKHFKFRVFVGDNYTHSGESFELPVGKNGELDIDKTDPLYTVLFDSHGNLKATVEAVVPATDGSGYHTLATAVRHGDGAALIAHKAAIIELSHPQTDTVQHDYSFIENETPVPPPPPVTDDMPWYIPIPWTPRDAMEVPTLDKEDKIKEGRAPRGPIGLPPHKPNAELSKKMLEENGFDEVIARANDPRRKIDSGIYKLEAELMEAAVVSYATSNGMKLTPSTDRIVRAQLREARTAEMRKPLEWNKAFSLKFVPKSIKHPDGDVGFEGAFGGLIAMNEFEQRLAVANPRPETLTIMMSKELLGKYVMSEEMCQQVFGPTFAQKFGAYGVKIRFVSEDDAEEELPELPEEGLPELPETPATPLYKINAGTLKNVAFNRELDSQLRSMAADRAEAVKEGKKAGNQVTIPGRHALSIRYDAHSIEFLPKSAEKSSEGIDKYVKAHIIKNFPRLAEHIDVELSEIAARA